MIKYRSLIIAFIFLIGIVLLNITSAQTAGFASSVAYQPRASFQVVYGPEGRLETYWPILGDKDTCLARQDLLLQISPAGCTPSVVRSDLLAEQNVPVFCQIDALQLNPLIDINEIRSISFRGNYPKEVVGAGFHPARAALATRDKLLGSPLINNIGYVVVVLKRTENEKTLPKFVNVTLSATIEYNPENAFGVGKAEYLLMPMSDDEWNNNKFKQSFWNGRYFVRLEQADPNFAIVSIYSGDRKISSSRIDRGQISNPIYVPGAYCRAGLQVAYDGFIGDKDRARIELSDGKGTDRFDVYEGSLILNNKCRVDKLTIGNNGTGSVIVSCPNNQKINLNIKDKSSATSTALVGETANNFNDAISSLERVADEYPAEKERDVEGSSKYGEKALIRAVELARLSGDNEQKANLIRKFIQLYPDSANYTNYVYELNQMDTLDFGSSTGVINLDNKFWNVRLVGIEKAKKTTNAEISITGIAEPIIVNLEELKNMTGMGANAGAGTLDSLRLDSVISNDAVRISANCIEIDNSGKTSIKSSQNTLRLGQDAVKICEKSYVKLRNINIGQIVKVRLIPIAQGTRTETNLSVNIGIEKRAIKLSTEKTEEMIENLNKSIEKWDSINNKLGKVVTGLKGACFATSAVLTVTNFLTGISGEALARQKVMNGDNGWTRICSDLVSQGKYVSLDACYLDKSNEIGSDVSEAEKVINDLNQRIENIEKPYAETGALGTQNIDKSKAAVAYCKDLLGRYGDRSVTTTQGVKTLKELIADCEKGYNEQGLYGYDELRELEYSIRMQNSGASGGIKQKADNEIKSVYNNILQNNERYSVIQNREKIIALGLPVPFSATSTIRKNVVTQVTSAKNVKSDVKINGLNNEYLASTFVYDSSQTKLADGKIGGFAGGTYLLGLSKSDEGYVVENVFKKEGDNNYVVLDNTQKGQFLGIYGIGNIVSAESQSYMNPYENPEVRYYETEPYKGMPAIVPIDVKNGWYAATRQTLPSFGGIGAFDASGRVTSFYLCNVGQDKREQFFEGFGDDICQLINLNTGQPLGFFPGLSEQEARSRVSQAVQAIQDAANQYGKKIVRIAGKDFAVGKPAANIPSTQCQNFMSPEECNLLFNVCDPVICPSSRCDFGGKYPVADVIQTGIIGSTLLCLPNFQEGIAVPVCLTGIHAGIDGFITIMKNHRDCLQESLATGRTVGICDQIYSVYLCEFFWRQVAPVAKVILPKIVEIAYGQGTRGGGEYLTVMAAWQNTQDSINYFTQSYAANSIKAFRIRSVEEAGEPICKAFISAKVPTSFKALVEPDSPPQFHAWFSATRFTDATVPATSQYKVFYHIFAGKDQGVQYSVFLKNPPESSFYTIPAVIHVASGFVGRGQYASESRDFTAPEGYKELCVRVNDNEECGFKEVSTSFAINYLRDSYVSEELKQSQVKTEGECISGSTNLGAAVLQPNIAAGAEEALLPSAYNRGVVRICSSQNPGSKTDPGRFVDVGYCDDNKIRCWLDKTSVEKAITDNNKGLQNETLSNIENRQRADLAQRGIIVGDDTANAEIKELGQVINGLSEKLEISDKEYSDGLSRLNALFGKVILNHHKAEILYMIGELKTIKAEIAIRKIKINSAIQNTADKVVNEIRAEEKKADEFSLNKSYNIRNPEKVYILLNGQKTKVYINDNKVFIDGSSTARGTINADYIMSLIPGSKDAINSAFGGGNDYYSMLNSARIFGDKIILKGDRDY